MLTWMRKSTTSLHRANNKSDARRLTTDAAALLLLALRQADAREGRMHAKLKRALQDRSPPPTVLWQEREEELEAQLVLAAERQQRAVGVFANRSQRLYARQLLLRCFLALRLDCAVSRQHAATGTWTHGFHGQVERSATSPSPRPKL